ncbi:NAD-dependent epimerase/dehydratase family protein [Thorsellia anophelis]|uniref:Nucleoside-diphosphate-sugar epimerase n=1 Tax=Thorsellia anophelis DSM 18579 TaxID=1123402 RepID=A0A1H9ZSZ0_9GAMM|nr:NAD-dependent epimerase/dehydratase family protein [Thorsellia anophelis]SES84462.1 Nucleoside-diphosphate-sugar epimerase [Thorsellia anophelis DSM 18579]
MKIAIIGLGWLGVPLAKKLSQNYQVVGSKRTHTQIIAGVQIFPLTLPLDLSIKPNIWKSNPSIDGLFNQTDIIAIILPASRQPEILAEYFKSVDQLIDLAIDYGVCQIIFTSSTSVYGDKPGSYDETASCEPVTASGKVLLEVEKNLLQRLEHKVTILRLAGLAGYNRHPGRFFSNPTSQVNKIDGASSINFVHGEDVVSAIEYIIKLKENISSSARKISTIYNLCSSIHPSKNLFYAYSASQLGLPPPKFKGTMVDSLTEPSPQNNRIIDGSRIIREIGFTYSYPNPYNFDYSIPF